MQLEKKRCPAPGGGEMAPHAQECRFLFFRDRCGRDEGACSASFPQRLAAIKKFHEQDSTRYHPTDLKTCGELVETLLTLVPRLCLLAVPLAAGLIGCTDPGPLEDDQPRAPSTHYRELRGEDPPLTVETPLGEQRPNLRERLLDR